MPTVVPRAACGTSELSKASLLAAATGASAGQKSTPKARPSLAAKARTRLSRWPQASLFCGACRGLGRTTAGGSGAWGLADASAQSPCFRLEPRSAGLCSEGSHRQREVMLKARLRPPI
eukprot:7484054-Pyramimonas_sp.AAC.1